MRSSLLAIPRKRGLAVGGTLVASAAVLAATWLLVPTTNAGAAVPPAPSGMTLVFSDDFNGTAGSGLNRTNWLYDSGHGYPGGAANWGTGEIETVTDSTANVFQDGQGHLAIKPI
ncbi:MAG: hypothetical protein QOD41_5023, partial [Cryptosporangiaceae bacterium]|nr:hypothetical protein [Cryptosporangiaceae bacterium]